MSIQLEVNFILTAVVLRVILPGCFDCLAASVLIMPSSPGNALIDNWDKAKLKPAKIITTDVHQNFRLRSYPGLDISPRSISFGSRGLSETVSSSRGKITE